MIKVAVIYRFIGYHDIDSNLTLYISYITYVEGKLKTRLIERSLYISP